MNKFEKISLGLVSIPLVLLATCFICKDNDWMLENGFVSGPFDAKKWVALHHPGTMALPEISNGQTEQQIVGLLGSPDTKETRDGQTVYTYNRSGLMDLAPFKVTFTSGKVSHTGSDLSPLNRVSDEKLPASAAPLNRNSQEAAPSLGPLNRDSGKDEKTP